MLGHFLPFPFPFPFCFLALTVSCCCAQDVRAEVTLSAMGVPAVQREATSPESKQRPPSQLLKRRVTLEIARKRSFIVL